MKHFSMQESRIVISEVMMPSQANPNGNVHGGEIMKLMDSAAYAAARRYARSNVVTARVDELEFHLPIRIGDLVVVTADVVYVGHSSMEIAVNVIVEDLDDGSRSSACRRISQWWRLTATHGRKPCRPWSSIPRRRASLSRKESDAMRSTRRARNAKRQCRRELSRAVKGSLRTTGNRQKRRASRKASPSFSG